jgi:hypothetical protein
MASHRTGFIGFSSLRASVLFTQFPPEMQMTRTSTVRLSSTDDVHICCMGGNDSAYYRKESGESANLRTSGSGSPRQKDNGLRIAARFT